MAAFDPSVIVECTQLSLENKIDFPQTVRRLAAISVERYYADLVELEKTYYGIRGETFSESLTVTSTPDVGLEFSEPMMKAALSAVQGNQIDYATFVRRIMAAGCVGYFVFIVGRKCVYWGRRGESYVENFPAPL